MMRGFNVPSLMFDIVKFEYGKHLQIASVTIGYGTLL